LHDATRSVQGPLVQTGVPGEGFSFKGQLVRWAVGVGAGDVKSRCCMKEVEDVLSLVLHFIGCFFIKIVVKGLEGSSGISWGSSINE